MSVFGISLQYSIRGKNDELAVQSIAAAFERAGDEFTTFGQYAFPGVLKVIEGAVAEQFLAQGRGPKRGGWSALTEPYATRKRKKYGPSPINVATGHLMSGLTADSSPFAVREYTASQLSYGTVGLPYATYPQTGTRRMVDRPPFDFTPETEAAITREAAKGARAAVKAAGLDQVTTLGDQLAGAE